MEHSRDWGLVARMVGVFAALIVLYVAFAGAAALYLGDIAVVGVMAVLIGGAQLYFGPQIALRSMGGHKVDAEEHPELHNRVQRLAQQAGLPKPDVAVADTKTPNAFAAGRSKGSSVVCVTTGLLETLDDDEIDAVIAHELAHIQHRDVAIMTVASVISALAFWVVRWGWLFDDGGGGDSDNPHLLVFILVSAVVWVLSYLVLRMLSRYREYAADRGAALITGQPASLATALRKIDGEMSEIPDEDMRSTGGANALCISPMETDRLTRLLETHPKTEDRVDQLEEMAADLEAGGH